MSIDTGFTYVSRIGIRGRFIFLILALVLSLTGFSPAEAAGGLTYFVNNTNPACADTNPGLALEAPLCTIGKGAALAVAGDTVSVLAGSYAETITVPVSGSSGLPITYTAAPGVIVTGNGQASGGNAFRISSKSYITINGFTITGTADHGIYVSASNNIILANNRISYAGRPVSGSTRGGIYLTGTTNSTISGNTTDHNTQDGIRLTSGSSNNMVNNNLSFANAEQWQRNAAGIHVYGSTSFNNTILRNITYANEDTGLQFYTGAHDNLVVGNLSYGNGDHGIDCSNAPRQTIIGNTIHGNHTAGINLEGDSAPGGGGAPVINNISVDNGIAPLTGQKSNIRVDASSIGGTTLDYNIVYLTGAGTSQIQWNGVTYTSLAAFQAAVPGQEVHGLQANPLFIAPVAPAGRPPAEVIGDYHLSPSSPAIDSANADAVSQLDFDLENKPRVDDPATTNTGAGVRAYDDRGAYEFQPVDGPTATPLPPSATPTATFTATATPINPPTNTSIPPTNTSLPPTNTSVPPTATSTAIPGTVSTLTFISAADSYVRESNVNSNYGTNTQLWAAYAAGTSYESYLKFNVSGVTGTVQSAVLRLYSTSYTVDGPAVYATNTNWTETGLTWATRPAKTSSGLDDKGVISNSLWVEYNVLPVISGDGTYSFALISTNADSISFSAREGTQPPQLVIVTVSGPAVTPSPTDTPLPPTATFTPTASNTPLPPTATFTPTNTSLPPTATFTPTATNTPLPPTATFTPSNTPVPPTATNTPLPPTATFTATATNTPAPVVNTGFHAPAANSAVTTNAGDNNGYQTTPANAYLADGLFAVDTNSGTTTSASCTNSGKDKHIFYTFSLNVPTSAAIQGIEVKLTGKANSTSSSPKFCVQLSWDGGTTWTAAKSTVTLSTANLTYLLGTSIDTWGRAWTGADFSDTNFRVRIINASSTTLRTFSLDEIAVQVTYK